MPNPTIVIPWRAGNPDREASLAFVSVWLRSVFPDSPVELADDGGDPFSRGASIDAAVAASAADLFVVCDADVLIPADQLVQAVYLASVADGQVIPFSSYRYLTGPATSELRGGPVSDDYWPGFDVEWVYPVGVGASCVFSRATHESAGGHPCFRGWGMEDIAFFMACEALVAPMRRIDGDCYHLWHPTGGGGAYYAEEQVAANVALMHRYSAAEGDPAKMRALVESLRSPSSREGGV